MAEKNTIKVSLRTIFEKARDVAQENQRTEAIESIQDIIEIFALADSQVSFHFLAMAFSDPDLYLDLVLESLPSDEYENPHLHQDLLQIIGIQIMSASESPAVLGKLLLKFEKIIDNAGMELVDRSTNLLIGDKGPYIEISIGEEVYEFNFKEIKLSNPLATYEQIGSLAQKTGEWQVINEALLPEDLFDNFKYDKNLGTTEEQQLRVFVRRMREDIQSDMTHLNVLFKRHKFPLYIEMYMPDGKNAIAYKLVQVEDEPTDMAVSDEQYA